MVHLIDKDALVAKIENLENTYKKCLTRNSYEDGLREGRLIGYFAILTPSPYFKVINIDGCNHAFEPYDEN